jgi:hypothetical protein
MPRTTAKKPAKTPSPKDAKPAATATDEQAPSEAERPSVKAIGYAPGDLVSHPMLGDGTVTAVDANKLNIKLTDGRVKQIVDADKLTIRFNEIVDY